MKTRPVRTALIFYRDWTALPKFPYMTIKICPLEGAFIFIYGLSDTSTCPYTEMKTCPIGTDDIIIQKLICTDIFHINGKQDMPTLNCL